MRTSRFTDSQIIAIHKQAEAGSPVPELCREHGIGNATFCKWRSKFGAMDVSLMARVKELEEESRRLEKMYERRGKPEAIRCDNGPEYICAATLAWPAKRRIRIDFIQPGQPQ